MAAGGDPHCSRLREDLLATALYAENPSITERGGLSPGSDPSTCLYTWTIVDSAATAVALWTNAVFDRALPRIQRAHQASRLRSVDDHAVPPAGVEVVLPPGRLAGRRASAMARRERTARQPQGGDRLGRPRSEGALEDRLPFRRLCESGRRPRRARGSVGRRAVLRRGAVVPSRRAAGRRVGGAAPKDPGNRMWTPLGLQGAPSTSSAPLARPPAASPLENASFPRAAAWSACRSTARGRGSTGLPASAAPPLSQMIPAPPGLRTILRPVRPRFSSSSTGTCGPVVCAWATPSTEP